MSRSTLTISIDDDVLKRARMRALDQGTSVNALLAEHLARFASGGSPHQRAISRLLEHSERCAQRADVKQSARVRGGRGWKRDDLYER